MRRTIEVLLGADAHPVGTLFYNREGDRQGASFAYQPGWLGQKVAWPIDPALPLVSGQQFRKRPTGQDSVFPGIIADTEPDGWGMKVIRRDHQKRRQVALRQGSTLPPPLLGAIDFLLGVDDVSRMGALRFQDEAGEFCRVAGPGERTTPALIELPLLVAASHRLERNDETAQDLEYLRGRGTSLGGMRPKCSVIEADGSLAIGKFPSVGDTTAQTKAEVLALRLAARAGIRAAQARIESSDGIDVAIVRRFDRIGPRRLLYASAATMLQAEPSDTSAHTYTGIVDALRRFGDQPRDDAAELWRRIAFSIMITNVDDHLRNHGFLHVAAGRWRLSPAFDINPFPDRVREFKTWISEESGPDMRIEALWAAAPYFGLNESTAAVILGEVEAAVASWREVAGGIGMTRAELEPFTDAFEHPERGRAQALVAKYA